MFTFLFSLLMGSGSHWWGVEVEASLNRAPGAKSAWVKMLRTAPPEHRADLTYLLEYMPERDLLGLKPQDLDENVHYAHLARKAVPWTTQIPESIYKDSILPYANVTETRENWRPWLYEKYLSQVKNFHTPAEAAQYLNRTLFKDTNVSYNIHRKQNDQSPSESISQGMATCTGLSIMLTDACRAVGIPARLTGICSWPGTGGNHTWVEIWDKGWHFAGAAEPDPNGLDRGWFVGNAAKAIKDQPTHAIYAVTYKKTNDYFPLDWDRTVKINAENVTDRYAPQRVASALPRIMVEVRKGNERVQAEVVAVDEGSGKTVLSGKSFGPHADVNDHLSTGVFPGSNLLVIANDGKAMVCRPVRIEQDQVVRIDLDKTDIGAVDQLLKDRFGPDTEKKETAEKILSNLEYSPRLEAAIWNAYRLSSLHDDLRKEFEANQVSTSDRTSPYHWRKVGQMPVTGWGLVIAMHGGGNVPKEENDAEWEGMFKSYYRDHPESGGYIYLALRAPNDTWNGFYDDSISPLVERLILQFVLFANVDPQHVYALGASHGGYGAFVIGPKIPYRFAAVHASAAAPTPGETMGQNLRDLRFTWMVGENDKDYGRAPKAAEFQTQVKSWKDQYGGYPGEFEPKVNTGHFVPDHDKVAEMRQFTREAWPKHVVWYLSDSVLHDFYWLHVDHPKPGAHIEAVVVGSTINITSDGIDSVKLRLNLQLMDTPTQVRILINGKEVRVGPIRTSIETYCSSLTELGDPYLAAPSDIFVSLR